MIRWWCGWNGLMTMEEKYFAWSVILVIVSYSENELLTLKLLIEWRGWDYLLNYVACLVIGMTVVSLLFMLILFLWLVLECWLIFYYSKFLWCSWYSCYAARIFPKYSLEGESHNVDYICMMDYAKYECKVYCIINMHYV